MAKLVPARRLETERLAQGVSEGDPGLGPTLEDLDLELVEVLDFRGADLALHTIEAELGAVAAPGHQQRQGLALGADAGDRGEQSRIGERLHPGPQSVGQLARAAGVRPASPVLADLDALKKRLVLDSRPLPVEAGALAGLSNAQRPTRAGAVEPFAIEIGVGLVARAARHGLHACLAESRDDPLAVQPSRGEKLDLAFQRLLVAHATLPNSLVRG